MSERDEYIPGVPCWVDASYKEPERVLPFYRGLFGWTSSRRWRPRVSGSSSRRSAVAAPPGSVNCRQFTRRCRPGTRMSPSRARTKRSAKVQAAGGEVLAPAFDVVDAGRMAILKPAGAVFCVWQAGRTKGAKVVNEHGAVNFNTLHTHDLDAAKKFYGEVFGWTTLSLGGAEFWTLAGYGDYLETIVPGMRKGAAEMGAAGFEDVVAVLEPLKDGEQPHWHVTFAVNDADVAAAEAPKLGGKVLVPPLDAPYVRLTVLADPEGTPFTASQFVAENR